MGHMTQRSRAASALFGSLVWAAAPCLAQAQEQEEEIVVTAQRREQALSDVPATINAFTGEQLNNLGVTQTNDLGLLTPNLSIGGAYAGYEESYKGKLAPNYLADFVVLDRDITRIAPETIRQAKVAETWVAGKLAYQAKP